MRRRGAAPAARLPLPEFVALTALLFSLIAYGTDAMLPALEQMAEGLGAPSVTRVQLVIAAFILGTGLGQLVAGPLSDAVGRRPVLLGGIGLFMAASLWGAAAGSLPEMLAARFVQGLGVSAPRTVSMALVRDLYQGRMMARVVSLAMTVFMLVPAAAPLLGQGIMLAFGWRAIFLSFVLFGAVAAFWLWLRQGETHPLERRRPFRAGVLREGLAEVLRSRRTVVSMGVLSLTYAFIFAYLSSAQQVFVDWLGTGHAFPLYFAAIALISGTSSAFNAWAVVRLGMWRLAQVGLGAVALASLGAAGALASGAAAGAELALFMGWSVTLFLLSGLIFANLNALALEPMGHVAGIASAIVGAVSALGSIAFAVPIGQAYDGTGLPLMVGIGICAVAGFALNLANPRQVGPEAVNAP